MKQPVIQLEKCQEARTSLYRGEFAPVILKFNQHELVVHAYDLSADGIGLIVPHHAALLPAASTQVIIVLPQAVNEIAGMVSHISETSIHGSPCYLLGISFLENKRLSVLREAKRYRLSRDKGPYMQINFEHPSFFSRHMCGQVLDISRDGLSFIVEPDVDLILMRTMIVTGTIMIPTGGELKLRFEVMHSRLEGNSRIYGCRILKYSSRYLQEVAEFLLANSQNASLSQLIAEGFQPLNTSRALRFGYAMHKEFSIILNLRREVAHYEGRMLHHQDEEAFSDEFDQHARHLYCEINGRIIGAVRILINNSRMERASDSQNKVRIPKYIWKYGFIEVSHLNVDPNFQHADIYLNILRQLIRIAVQDQQRYILLSCPEEQCEVLAQLGAYPLDLRYYDNEWGSVALNVMVLDASKSLLGRGLGPLNWGVFSKPLTDFLLKQQQLKPSLWDRIRLNAFQFIFQPASRFYGERLRQRFDSLTTYYRQEDTDKRS